MGGSRVLRTRHWMGAICGAVIVFTGSASAQEDANAQEAREAVPREEANTESELPRERRAVELALDASYAASGTNDLNYGGGAALRAGYVFPFKWAALVPEGGVEMWALSGSAGNDGALLYGAFGGARARFGRGLEPGVFAHYGVTGVSWRDTFAAPTVDVGMFIELTYLERMVLGALGMYKSTISTGGNPSISWYTAGLMVGTRFY